MAGQHAHRSGYQIIIRKFHHQIPLSITRDNDAYHEVINQTAS